jgi:hypothetical protein
MQHPIALPTETARSLTLSQPEVKFITSYNDKI